MHDLGLALSTNMKKSKVSIHRGDRLFELPTFLNDQFISSNLSIFICTT